MHDGNDLDRARARTARDALIGAAQARLELLADDLEVQGPRIVVLAAAAAIALSLAVAFGSLLLAVLFWDTHRVEVLALLTGVFAVIGTCSLSAIRWMLRVPRTWT